MSTKRYPTITDVIAQVVVPARRSGRRPSVRWLQAKFYFVSILNAS